jgi:pSer/pThr/pTyr-binding forkhead associated (FHA) protein
MLDKSINIWSETKVWRELAVSLVSLNDKTAATVDFPQSALSDSGSAEISCGRAPDNAVVLEDKRVSAHHFTLRVSCGSGPDKENQSNPGEMQVELLDGSSNGTWVNDQPVGKGRKVPISTGDRIFVLPSAQVGAAAAIGFVVVALPFQSQKSQQQNAKVANGTNPARQLVSTVQCRLCSDALIHRCVTVVPCGHNFCCGCMITWCKGHGSPECPACKGPVRQLVRNHSVDSIVDTFIRAHPEASRAPESLERLNTVESDAGNHASPASSARAARTEIWAGQKFCVCDMLRAEEVPATALVF